MKRIWMILLFPFLPVAIMWLVVKYLWVIVLSKTDVGLGDVTGSASFDGSTNVIINTGINGGTF